MYIQTHTVDDVVFVVVVVPYARLFLLFPYSLCLEAHTIVSLLVAHSFFLLLSLFGLEMAWAVLLLCAGTYSSAHAHVTSPPPASHIVVH